MQFVIRTNWLLLALFTFGLIPLFFQENSHWYLNWIDLLTFAGVLALQLVLLFKSKALYGFSLVLLYTLALIHGLKIMLSLGSLDSALAVLMLIFHVFLILYFIGVRGFLRSNRGREALGLPIEPDKNS